MRFTTHKPLLLCISLCLMGVMAFAQQPGTNRFMLPEQGQKVKAGTEAARNGLTHDQHTPQTAAKEARLQQGPDPRCGFVYAEELRRQKYPQLPTPQQFERWMQSEQLRSRGQAARQVVTIPVVVHIIHNGEEIGTGNNLSDAQVMSQIEVLNQDFRRMNADAANTPSDFLPVAADSEIEFCLATVDPFGNPTNGINRINGGQDFYSMSDFEGGLKQSTIWHPFYYFNIWVAPLNGGLLGYAQFPDASGLDGMPVSGGSAATDGIVVNALSFGVGGSTQPPYHLGRTATHEAGHFFGLRHIGGDGSCAVDDFVDDTPVQNGQNLTSFPCTYPGDNDCDEGPGDLPDMFQNYMDYTDDTCMNLFTQGQKARFDVVLANSPRRKELLNSQVCQGIAPPDTFEIPVPENDLCAGALPIQCGDTVVGSTLDATNLDTPGLCGVFPEAPGVWYSFVAGGEEVSLSLCNSDYDTKVNVYKGNCDSLECVVGNDDDCGFQSKVDFPTDSGATYFVYVNGWSSSVGNYELIMSCHIPGPPPANNLCQDAVEVACGQSIAGTTRDATSDGAPLDECGTIPGAPGVWYTIVGNGQIITASTCDQANYDTKINVYSGSCDTLNCVAGNNDNFNCSDGSSRVDFVSEAGKTYYIYVNGNNGQRGDFTLSISCNDPSDNDVCSKAIPISCGDVIMGNTEFSTSAGVPATDCEAGPFDDSLGPGIWYVLTGTGENVTLSTCGEANFDTKIDVFTGSCDSLVCYAGNDDGNGCAGFTSFLNMPTVAGETYYVYLSGFAGATGEFTLTVCPTCEITGMELDPFFPQGPVCNDGTFGPQGTYFVYFKVDGITPTNVPLTSTGQIDTASFEIKINGVDYPVFEAGFDNLTIPGLNYFFVGVNGIPGTGADDVDVFLSLKDECEFNALDLYDAPGCEGAGCAVNEVSVLSGPSCNGDGTFDVCFFVDGHELPASAAEFSSEKFFIAGAERQEKSYELVEGGANICFTIPLNDVELNNGNIDVFIQLGIGCKRYKTQLFAPPACNARFGSSPAGTSLQEQIRIYPNPTQGVLNVQTGALTGAQLQVMNALGQLVYTLPLQAYTHKQLQLARFGSGLFIVRIIGEGQRIDRKIIVE